jgi:hypothetical protein
MLGRFQNNDPHKNKCHIVMNNCRSDLTYICARNVAAGIKIDADELAESAGIVVLHGLGVAEGLQNGIGLEQLLLQFTLHTTNSEHISISAISISAISISDLEKHADDTTTLQSCRVK